jgi:hypothetical protein
MAARAVVIEAAISGSGAQANPNIPRNVGGSIDDRAARRGRSHEHDRAAAARQHAAGGLARAAEIAGQPITDDDVPLLVGH